MNHHPLRYALTAATVFCLATTWTIPAAFAQAAATGTSTAAADQSAPKIPACAEKAKSLLDAAHYAYKTTKDPKVNFIPVTGKNDLSYKVVLATSENLVVIFVNPLLPHGRVEMNSEFMMKVLKLNDTYDTVKIGIDKDSDLFVRSDLPCRLVDQEDLTTQIHQVQVTADEIYGQLKSYIK
jgi:hypothetical protein